MITDVYLDEEMEMPCPCQCCGKWFDLNDGVGYGGVVYCEECGSRKRRIKDLDRKILDIEDQMEMGITKKREGKKSIKGIKLEIVKLENQLP